MSYVYTITPEMALHLQQIERVRTSIGLATIPPGLASSLRIKARIRSTHFSTRIEGNRLDLQEVQMVVLEDGIEKGQEKDSGEVQRYYQALEWLEDLIEKRVGVSEEKIQSLHARIFAGKRAKASPFRDGQNAVRDSASGQIVYMPPEFREVPALMGEMVEWITANGTRTPIPLVAGMTHYQLVTIHPWYDGNGRTARALATWTLYRGGYDLGRMYSLEEEYARDLERYYAALQTSPQHNYYDGRNTADVTPWMAYFLRTMKDTFERLADEIQKMSVPEIPGAEQFARQLDRRARMVLGLLQEKKTIGNRDVALLLDLSERQTRDLLLQWTKDGWLEMTDPSRKARRYSIAKKYRRFIGDLSAE